MRSTPLPAPIPLIGAGLLRIGAPLAGLLPLLAVADLGYWPWAGGVEIGAAALTGLLTLGFALLALSGDGRARALLRPAPAGLFGLALLGAALSPLWGEPARALFGHPAIGFGGLWLLLAGLVAATMSVIPAGAARSATLAALLLGGLFGLVGAVGLGAHSAALPLLLLGLLPLLPERARPGGRAGDPRVMALAAALAIALTGLMTAPQLLRAERLIGAEGWLFGAGWGGWHELTVAGPAPAPLSASPALTGSPDPAVPGVARTPSGLLAEGLPSEGAGRLTTGSVLGDLLVGVGLAGAALLVLTGYQLCGVRTGGLIALAAPLTVLAALPPTLALAPLAGLLLSAPDRRDGDPAPLPRLGRLLGLPALAVAMGGVTVTAGLVRTAEFAAHDRLLPNRFMEQAGRCIATRSSLIPERDVHVALQRMLIGRVLGAQSPYEELLAKQSVLASNGCILEEHLRDRPGPLILEARLEMRGAILAVNRHLAETGAPEAPLQTRLGPWVDDLAALLPLAPARTDLLDAFLEAAAGPDGEEHRASLRDRLIAARDPALDPLASRIRAR